VSTALLLAIAVPAAICASVIALLRHSRLGLELADQPNERSLHDVPRPRVGGLAILAGALPAAFIIGSDALAPILACMAALALVSLADDLKSLPIAVRLAAHAAACAIAYGSIAGEVADNIPAWSLAVIVVVAMMWMTNLFNFMDGADGLAGGMALIGFGAFAAAALAHGDAATAGACVAIAAASAAFLFWNFPPARVFMGDAGSIPIGFAAAAIALHGVERGLWPWWFAPAVFSPFIVDATVTLAARILRREPFWRAHRSHHYQSLALAGWPRRRLALAAYALMGACAAAALAALGAGHVMQLGILLALFAAYPPLLFTIARYARSSRKPTEIPHNKNA
jgi:UDP-GlcNAc:undecaprenyl-phosphate GlcNAc-1-phosphate transferase